MTLGWLLFLVIFKILKWAIVVYIIVKFVKFMESSIGILKR